MHPRLYALSVLVKADSALMKRSIPVNEPTERGSAVNFSGGTNKSGCDAMTSDNERASAIEGCSAFTGNR